MTFNNTVGNMLLIVYRLVGIWNVYPIVGPSRRKYHKNEHDAMFDSLLCKKSFRVQICIRDRLLNINLLYRKRAIMRRYKIRPKSDKKSEPSK
jgi:hypothetical protein